jgi:hypothetical protein
MLSVIGALVILLQQPVPRPFPKPGEVPPSPPPAEKPVPPPSSGQAPADRAIPPPTRKPVTPPPVAAPTQEELGLPIYPSAQFLASYDAGRGQRYYLFGTNATFAEIVAYYKTYLKDGGERVYDEPPIHMWEVGRFREEEMAFPPGITVKDYTWNGSQGWLNSVPGAPPQRFKTVIQLVPSPGPGVPAPRSSAPPPR